MLTEWLPESSNAQTFSLCIRRVGHPVHEAPDLDVREIHAASYRIIYRVLLDEVEIVTLVHFAQRLNLRRLR